MTDTANLLAAGQSVKVVFSQNEIEDFAVEGDGSRRSKVKKN